MKDIFITIVVLAQISASIYLGYIESWVSGLVFFIVTTIFIGLMARVAELTNKLWSRIFGKD
jgi:hypothetical protein